MSNDIPVNLCDKGGSVVSEISHNTVIRVCSLLAIDPDDLRRSLTSRVMTTTKKGAVGTVIKYDKNYIM